MVPAAISMIDHLAAAPAPNRVLPACMVEWAATGV